MDLLAILASMPTMVSAMYLNTARAATTRTVDHPHQVHSDVRPVLGSALRVQETHLLLPLYVQSHGHVRTYARTACTHLRTTCTVCMRVLDAHARTNHMHAHAQALHGWVGVRARVGGWVGGCVRGCMRACVRACAHVLRLRCPM